MTRFECPECNRMVTRGPSGIEYGHARRARWEGGTGRCSRRPDCVDPSKPSSDRDGWALSGGEEASSRPVRTDGGDRCE